MTEESCRPVSSQTELCNDGKLPKTPPVPGESLTENQKHQQGTQSSDILSHQKTSSQPLVQPVHNDQEEAIQCYPFYQTRISCQQFLQFTIQPKDNCFPSELTLRGETLRRQIYLHSTITNSIRRVSAQEM